MQDILRVLRDEGANCDWVEPDGTIVTKDDIDALCAMDPVQLKQQAQPKFGMPNWYTWDALGEEDDASIMESLGSEDDWETGEGSEDEDNASSTGRTEAIDIMDS